MRILVLNHEYPPVGGGGGRVAKDLNFGLIEKGHKIKILTPALKNLPKREVFNNYEVIRIPSLRRYAYRATLLDMGAFIISSFLYGSKLIRKWKPDLIHAHFAVPAGAAARYLSKKHKIPYFLTAHLGDIPGGAPEKTANWFKFLYPLTKNIWEEAARVITVSHWTNKLAYESYPTVSNEVIYNGVDIKNIKPKSFKIHDPLQIVFAGRFTEQKNPLMIIEVLNQLKNLKWKCIMMGDGFLRPDVEQKIKDYGMGDRFELTGWINPDKVLEIYSDSDILFMTSRSEGLPVAGVQAIAMGLVPVLSNVGGCPDLVENGKNGFLIEENDLDGYVKALRMLINDADLLQKHKKKSREISKKFDLSLIIEKYEKVMKDVVS